MPGFTLSPQVSNTFSSSVSLFPTEEALQSLTMYLKLYHFGDEEATEEYISSFSQNVISEYQESLAKMRSGLILNVSISYDCMGEAEAQLIPQEVDYIDAIKTHYKCTDGCAKDIWHLRHLSDWSLEKEEEIISLHNSGVPTSTTLFN
jgi:hypothetical protein